MNKATFTSLFAFALVVVPMICNGRDVSADTRLSPTENLTERRYNVSGNVNFTLDRFVSVPRRHKSFSVMDSITWNLKTRKGDGLFLTDESNSPVFQLTDTKESEATAFTFRDKLLLNLPFKIEFDYCAEREGWAADGMAIAFHNDPRGVEALGAHGNSYGLGGSGDYTAVTPSLGFFLQYYSWNSAGTIIDGVKTTTCDPHSDVIFRNAPLHMILTYDGSNKLTWQISRDGCDTQVLTHEENLATKLGAPTGYFAIYGSTGGYVSKQLIKNLELTYMPDDFFFMCRKVDGLLDPNATWVLNSFTNTATPETPELSTDAGGVLVLNGGELKNAATSAALQDELNISVPFTLSFTYRAENGSASSTLADGFSCVFHRDARGANAVGAYAGKVGVGGNSLEMVRPSRGFAFTFYNEIWEDGVYRGVSPLLKIVRDGELSSEAGDCAVAPGMSKCDVFVTMNYDGTRLVTTFSRDGYEDVVLEENVNLEEALGAKSAYFMIGGATGGGVVNQCIKDFSFSSQGANWEGYNLDFTIDSGSLLTIRSDDVKDCPGSSIIQDMTLRYADNSAGVAFDGSFNRESKIKIVFPERMEKKSFRVADLSAATGLTKDDFEFSGDTKGWILEQRGDDVVCSPTGFIVIVR